MSAISITDFFEKEGELSVIGNNSPLMLFGPDNIWFIKSGSIDVFSVLNEGNQPKGARVYLFSLSAGNILFGMNPGHSCRSFLAVGNTNVNLYKVNVDKLKLFLNASNNYESFAVLIDKWILSLSAGTARDSSLRYDIAIDKPGMLSIPENKKIKARKGVLWLEIENECITLLDSEVEGGDGNKYFPLTDNSWILSIKSFQAKAISTIELLEHDSFWQFMVFYHEQILTLEELNIRMLMVDDFVRNKEKIEIRNQVVKEAYNNIAGILGNTEKKDQGFKTNDPLLEACRILGVYLGIKILEPQNNNSEKLTGLDDIARASKFGYRKITFEDKWWHKDAGALLTFTKDKKNPAVLIPGAAGRYTIKIPSEDINTKLTPELACRLENYAYAFYKPFPFKKITPVEFVKFIFQSCKKEIIVLLSAGSTGGLLTLFVPLLTGIIIDSVIPQSDRMKLYGFGFSLIFSVIALIFAQVIRSMSYIRLDTKLDYLVQSALWDRLINLPVGFFKKFSSGELAAKANSLSFLKQILTYSVINTVIYNSFMVFNLFLLFYYDLFLGFISIIIFSVFLYIVFVTGIKLKNKNLKIIKYENSISSLITQTLNSISKLKIAGTENLAFKLWTDKYSLKQEENLKIRNYSNLIIILNSVFPVIATVLIFYLLTLERYTWMSAGTMLSFLTAFNIFLLSIVQITNASVMFFMAVPLYENSKEILHSLPEYSQAKEQVKELKGEIEISHVYFRYNKESDYVLSDISITIKPGEFIAIVGTSGSGKSTLLRLLLGFDSPEMGAVYFDKQNIESVDKSSLRRQIGTVLQNSKLFPGNIYSNIAGVDNISVNDVNEIAKLVGLDEDLKTMPMGVFTVINEGVSTLSGGQRQKILLAKALKMKPAILLLDEATSALDNESQNVITENLSKIQATKIFVAHRLSTIKYADRIYVLEKGRIVECGNFEELMNKNGYFSELVKRQLSEE